MYFTVTSHIVFLPQTADIHFSISTTNNKSLTEDLVIYSIKLAVLQENLLLGCLTRPTLTAEQPQKMDRSLKFRILRRDFTILAAKNKSADQPAWQCS